MFSRLNTTPTIEIINPNEPARSAATSVNIKSWEVLAAFMKKEIYKNIEGWATISIKIVYIRYLFYTKRTFGLR